jgi:hypothetical protein
MRIFLSKLTVNVFAISALAALGLFLTSHIFHNPLWPNCNIYGCEFGRGWPLPDYYSIYCKSEDTDCSAPYVNILSAVLNFGGYFFLIAFAMTSVSKEELTEPDPRLIEKR